MRLTRRLNSWSLRLLAGGCLIGSGLTGCGSSQSGTTQSGNMPPVAESSASHTPATATTTTTTQATTAPAEVQLAIADYDTIQAAIARHQGKVVVVDLWSTSCEPCTREFPELVKLSRHYPAERLACVSVSFDYIGLGKPEETLPEVLEFLKSQDARFENFLGSEDDATLSKKFGIPAIPIVLVYDANGQKAATFGLNGEFTYEVVRAKVAELLGK